MVLGSCIELLESSEIGYLHYPDEEATNLCSIARQVGEMLILEGLEGCDSKRCIVAATLFDLPYSRDYRTKVDKIFGKKPGTTWEELSMVRIHEDYNIMKRLKGKAPHMSGAARAALMAWLCVLGSRVAGRNPPKDWTGERKAEYLSKIEAVAQAICEKGNKTDLDPVIKQLGEKISHTVKQF